MMWNLGKMRGKSRVMLNTDFWKQAQSKQELKQLIGNYMSKNYPDYIVLEIHKYYAICYIGRN